MEHVTNHDWMVAFGLVFFKVFSALDPIVLNGMVLCIVFAARHCRGGGGEA